MGPGVFLRMMGSCYALALDCFSLSHCSAVASLRQRPDLHLLLAVDSLRLVFLGYALVRVAADTDSDAGFAQVAVEEHFRRLGLGGCLVDLAVDLATQRGRRLAAWSLPERVNFYWDLGFCTEPAPHDGPEFCVFMAHTP